MADIIKCRDVSKRYADEGGRLAVRDLSLSVGEGEFVCLIGPSGCGKSTILKLIAGLEEASGGAVIRPDTVAMAFQAGALLPWLTAFENAALGLRARGLPERDIVRIVHAQLEAVGIPHLRGAYPAELSGGERQRVGIARALAVDPAVLLLDEPFSALDPKTTAELHEDLLRIWRQTKKTIVMVSHLIEEAVGLAERVILMHEGAIAAEYRIDLPHPRHEQGEAFMREVVKIRREFFR